MTDPTAPFTRFSDLNREEALQHTMALVSHYWQAFEKARPNQPEVDETLREALDIPLPEYASDPLVALDHADNMLDKSLSQPRPRYFAFVGSSGLEMGVLADVLAASHDINLAVYAGAADLVEQQALRWVAEFIGYPGYDGTFTSGGMLSNLTALTAARTYALPDCRTEGIRHPVAVYISRDAHSSVERAVEILGIGSRAIHDIELDEHRRMDVDHLRETLESDLAAGVTPVAIVASAGTTLAGAIDPIASIAQVANEHSIWLHIDGAYGMPAASLDSKRTWFDGLQHAHSITVDAHKWLFLPKPCGILLIKDRKFLLDTFSHDASYIQDNIPLRNPVEWTLEYSRPLRALKVWLAFLTYGAEAFRQAISENLDLAALCTDLVQESEKLELQYTPQLSVVLFRHIPSSPTVDINHHNRELARTLQQDGRIYVAGADVDGTFCLRACFVNYRTRPDDVRAMIDVVNELGDALEANLKGGGPA